MKKPLFICILTITFCLGVSELQTDVSKGNSSVPSITPQPPKTEGDNKTPGDKTPIDPPKTPTTPGSIVTSNNTTNSTSKQSNETIVAPPVSVNATNETSNIPPKPEGSNPPKPGNEVPKNETETSKPTVPTAATKPTEPTKPTEATKTPTTEAPKVEQAAAETRRFDSPSFIGGIILTLGLIAIGFMGFKYYRAQTERNYHTL